MMFCSQSILLCFKRVILDYTHHNYSLILLINTCHQDKNNLTCTY